jgi:tripartite ATP-independent transporter DctM subunit
MAAMAAAATSDRVPLDLLVQQMVAQVQSFPLIAIPFFMLTGSLMMGGRLGAALVGVLSTLIGRFHGGPAQVGVLSSTLFGGVSGSAVADASAIGSLLIPWHKRLGYPPAFSAATLAAAATIDILIPPSIPMILFALTANASIAALFVAGILPGLLMCGGFMFMCWWVGRRRNFPRDLTPIDWSVFRTHLMYASPALLLPVLIVVFLRFGIATPTEVAVLSTLYAAAVSVVVYRDLSFKRLNDAVVSAGLATGVVLLVIMASAAIGWLLTYDQMPSGVANWVTRNVSQDWIVILIMNLLMLFLGMFIDLPAAILLLTPVFLPLAQSIGMDPVQLGIMMVVNLAVGLYTPPVGTTLFITSALAKVKVGQTVRELGPFYFVAFLVLALVSYVPASILRPLAGRCRHRLPRDVLAHRPGPSGCAGGLPGPHALCRAHRCQGDQHQRRRPRQRGALLPAHRAAGEAGRGAGPGDRPGEPRRRLGQSAQRRCRRPGPAGAHRPRARGPELRRRQHHLPPPGRATAADALAAMALCLHTHIKDVKRTAEGYFFTALGEGEIGCAEILHGLRNSPVSLSIEIPMRLHRGSNAQPSRSAFRVPLADIEARLKAALDFVHHHLNPAEVAA